MISMDSSIEEKHRNANIEDSKKIQIKSTRKYMEIYLRHYTGSTILFFCP